MTYIIVTKLRYLFALLILIASHFSRAAQITDSLNHALKSYTSKDSVRVDMLNELSYSYWIMDPAKAEILSKEALEIATNQSYLKGMAMANRSIGVASWAQGNYEEGLNVLLTALSQYQLLKDTLNIANVKLNTGLIYSEQNSFAEALLYYQDALKTFRYLNKPERSVNTLNHIGVLYQRQGNTELAKSTYNEALEVSRLQNYAYGKSTALSNLSNLFQRSGKLDSAIVYAREALQIQEESNDLNGEAFSLYNLGIIYQKLENYELTHEYLQRALKEAEVISSKKLKRDCYWQLKQTAKMRGNYQEALQYAEQYNIVNDSLFNAEKLREFVRLENRFSLEKNAQELKLKDQEVDILQKAAVIDRLWRNSAILVIVAILLISYFIYSRQRINLKRKQELFSKNEEIYRTNAALTEAELENARWKEIELNQKIEFKNKELTSYALNFVQKNEVLEEIKSSIGELKKSPNGVTAKELNSLNKLVSSSMHIDKDWQDFKRQFEEVHTNFFTNLKTQFPTLSSNELKLCALLKLNMNLKEASTVMGISPESVKTARYRLRKKLGLGRSDNLVEHIISLEIKMNE
ncbi:Tetratricopeptide repeat-containing protein [Marivirga sericea]|uniref:Tetratricopeptide repeat-containing protein n=1 Tax=Marivirga sericea TaxID=1028 RepID=A0A1X7IGK4_9BACT|nr:tetratricopeptide repeat protein [Marivirga sericea]SMG13651.1 Tetratricopeptide repeat-containing protein [Marivirga sericea]